MKRISGSGYNEAISTAFDMLPGWLAELLTDTHFLCGVNPVFAGLHSSETAEDGRSYSNTAHAAFRHHTADGSTTVVLPVVVPPWVVIHELGHVLDELLGWPPVPEPITKYAQTNRLEAFAEAFTKAHVPGYADWDISARRLHEYRAEHPDLAPFFTGSGG